MLAAIENGGPKPAVYLLPHGIAMRLLRITLTSPLTPTLQDVSFGR